MKIYIDEAEIGSTISYTEENGKKQNLYVHDKEGFVFKSLKERLEEKDKEIETLTRKNKIIRIETCEKIKMYLAKLCKPIGYDLCDVHLDKRKLDELIDILEFKGEK